MGPNSTLFENYRLTEFRVSGNAVILWSNDFIPKFRNETAVAAFFSKTNYI